MFRQYGAVGLYALSVDIFEDAIVQMKMICAPLDHCKTCFTANIFAMTFILHFQNGIFKNSPEFRSRAKQINEGLFLFLQRSYASSACTILPQLEGVVMDYLERISLIDRVNGDSFWAETTSIQGKCENIREALEVAKSSDTSLIGKTVDWYSEKLLDSVLRIREELIRGRMIRIGKHKAVDIILLLTALYIDLELYDLTLPKIRTRFIA
jgi:hypothetical protein